MNSSQLKSILKDMNIYPGISEISETQDLFALGVLDSLLLIQFVLLLEEKLKIRMKNEDISYDNFKSLQQICELLNKYQKS